MRCAQCGYGLTGTTGSHCPACGGPVDFKSRSSEPRAGGALFSVDFTERLHRSQVNVRWDNRQPPHTPALDAMIEDTWQRHLAVARRTGQLLYNGPMVRLDHWRLDEAVMTLETGPTDYRHFIGTNYGNGDRIDAFGHRTYANPVGISAVPITTDGWMLLGRRRPDLACHGGYLHPIGGTLEPQDRADDGALDVFAAMERELTEELCITSGEIAELVCIGLIRDGEIHQPELVFEAVTTLDRQQILERFDPAAPGQEHSALESCPDRPDAVAPFIGPCHRIAPICVGSILLHGLQAWGRDWFESACHAIMGHSPPPTPSSGLTSP